MTPYWSLTAEEYWRLPDDRQHAIKAWLAEQGLTRARRVEIVEAADGSLDAYVTTRQVDAEGRPVMGWNAATRQRGPVPVTRQVHLTRRPPGM